MARELRQIHCSDSLHKPVKDFTPNVVATETRLAISGNLPLNYCISTLQEQFRFISKQHSSQTPVILPPVPPTLLLATVTQTLLCLRHVTASARGSSLGNTLPFEGISRRDSCQLRSTSAKVRHALQGEIDTTNCVVFQYCRTVYLYSQFEP